MSTEGLLLAVWPDGQHMYIENEYESISRVFEKTYTGLMDFVSVDGGEWGMYLPDDMHGESLNTTVSWFASFAVFGPVVVTRALPGDDGETVAADPRLYEAMVKFAVQWRRVWVNAENSGQDLNVHGDADNLPPPQVITIEQVNTFEDFLRAIEGERDPGGGDA